MRYGWLVLLLWMQASLAAPTAGELKVDIAAQQAAIKVATLSRKGLQTLLEKEAKAASDAQQSLSSLKRKLATKTAALVKLEKAQQKAARQQTAQAKILGIQLRAIYQNTHQGYLQALLSQDDPAAMQRGLQYYRYFHEAQAAELAKISGTLTRLVAEQQVVVAARQEIKVMVAAQAEKQQILIGHKATRQAAVKVLDKQIQSQSAKLADLKRQQKSLNKLMQKLASEQAARAKRAAAATAANRPGPSVGNKPTKGNRQWPLRGKQLVKYNSINFGKTRWDGMVIGAPVGRAVKAAAAGEVVFAEWMRGRGLLVIVAHSGKEMTLYGNNQALSRKVGDKVAAGDVLAYSGDDGMREYSGLYFEVRREGKPINPVSWLSK